MSGGHFDYKQYAINDIAYSLEKMLRPLGGYSKETISEFETGLKYIKLAAIYTQRIDWLLSGDDGEETFHTCLAEDLNELNTDKPKDDQ